MGPVIMSEVRCNEAETTEGSGACCCWSLALSISHRMLPGFHYNSQPTASARGLCKHTSAGPTKSYHSTSPFSKWCRVTRHSRGLLWQVWVRFLTLDSGVPGKLRHRKRLRAQRKVLPVRAPKSRLVLDHQGLASRRAGQHLQLRELWPGMSVQAPVHIGI